MGYSHERVLLALKYVDDVTFDPDYKSNIAGTVTGYSLKVIARTRDDGRTAVSASVYHRIQRMRASGKGFHYWQPVQFVSLSRTKQDLIVKREYERSSLKRSSSHVFAGDAGVDAWLTAFGYQLTSKLREMSKPRALEGPVVTRDDGQLTTPFTEKIIAETSRASMESLEHLGELPVWKERFPLLARRSHSRMPGFGYLPYLDAQDHAQVAKKLFGVRAYRKPLAAAVQRLDMYSIAWFQIFRGLVPIDWIIDAMRAASDHAFANRTRSRRAPITSAQLRNIRRILRRTPEQVLGRILKEPITESMRVLIDAANDVDNVLHVRRDLDQLPGLIAARGQRRVRSSRDLEQLIRAIPEQRKSLMARREASEKVMQDEAYEHNAMRLYNEARQQLIADGATGAPEATWAMWQDDAFRQRANAQLEEARRARMDDRQRRYNEMIEARRARKLIRNAARHTWAVTTETLIADLDVAPGLAIEIARSAETLSMWGSLMNNCIGGYNSELGLDVLAAVVNKNTGTVILNLQITQEEGVVQFLGKNNRGALKAGLSHATAQQIVDSLIAAGVPFDPGALGISGLRIEPAQPTAHAA